LSCPGSISNVNVVQLMIQLHIIYVQD